MSLWLNEVGLVLRSGQLLDCDECPCTGTGTGTGTQYHPGYCTRCISGLMAYEVEVDFPGLSNKPFSPPCTGCPTYAAGTYVLRPQLPSFSPILPYDCAWAEWWVDLVGSDPCSLGWLQVKFDTVGSNYVITVSCSGTAWLKTVGPSSTSLDCVNFTYNTIPIATPSSKCNPIGVGPCNVRSR